METLLQDIRYGARVLWRKPLFTTVAVLTLTLGVGANTAIFSVVNGVLLRPLPYKDSDRIQTLWQNNKQEGVEREDVSSANFLDWRDQTQSFDQMSLIEPFSLTLLGTGDPENFRCWLVTSGFFEILGVGALHGRTFLPEEYQPGSQRAVVIGYGLWQRRFGGDPGIVGTTLMLSGQPVTVVGVMPPEFQFPAGREVWFPRFFTERDRQIRGSPFMKSVARLKSGVTVEQAQADLDGVALRLAQQYPETNRGSGASVVPLGEQLVGNVRPALLMLLGAVGFVLLIACANVANLTLARGAERQKELAIRAALGARRARLLRQLLTESVLLAVIGGVGGILLAVWGTDLIVALGPRNLPRLDEVGISPSVFVFALAVSLITALIFGLIPSLQFSKPDLNESLKEGGRSSSGFVRQRLRAVLVISEVALALTLLVGAGLLIRSFARLLQTDPGFTADRALTLEVHVWGTSRTPEQRAAFFEQTLDRISLLPGVQSAAAVSSLPFHDNRIGIEGPFTIEGRPSPTGQEQVATSIFATTDYFKSMGIPLLRGRTLTRFDNQDAAQVMLINDAMARRFWPDDDPVGKKLTFRAAGPPVTREIVGVVGDTKQAGLDSNPRPEIFLPHLQSPYGSMTYIVRTTADPVSLLSAVKNEIWSVNKDQPFASISTMEGLVSRSLGDRRFNLILLGAFASIALVLAGVGIYGVISFSTSQRIHEIGVRVALGASRGDIFRLVVRQALILTLAGVGIGLVAALVLTRYFASMLFGVTASDPLTFAGVSLLLCGVAFGASYIPARRAMRVDPMTALRYE
jgi:putative ABC transport system permease protein